MINFKIIEIPEEEINPNDPTCLMNAFKYMVEDEKRARWFGSNEFQKCEDYITQHTTNN